MKTLLLGMGNPILCDDAVGVRLAQEFKNQLSHIPDLDIIEECSVGGLNLLDLCKGYDRVIILDAFQAAGGVPGDWYCFTASALSETIHLTNVHDTNLATALALGRTIGMILPELSNVLIFGVEIKENTTFSESMSPELEEHYPRFSLEILKEIEALLQIDPADDSPTRRAPGGEITIRQSASHDCGSALTTRSR
jgi:hydrogenase maturation protease